MAGIPGGPKKGGRKKGVPNYSTTYSVHTRLKDIGFDLVGTIISEIKSIKAPYERTRCYLQLLEYCDAKRKAVEVKIDNDREKIRNLPDAELTNLVKQTLPKESE